MTRLIRSPARMRPEVPKTRIEYLQERQPGERESQLRVAQGHQGQTDKKHGMAYGMRNEPPPFEPTI